MEKAVKSGVEERARRTEERKKDESAERDKEEKGKVRSYPSADRKKEKPRRGASWIPCQGKGSDVLFSDKKTACSFSARTRARALLRTA